MPFLHYNACIHQVQILVLLVPVEEIQLQQRQPFAKCSVCLLTPETHSSNCPSFLNLFPLSVLLLKFLRPPWCGTMLTMDTSHSCDHTACEADHLDEVLGRGKSILVLGTVVGNSCWEQLWVVWLAAELMRRKHLRIPFHHGIPNLLEAQIEMDSAPWKTVSTGWHTA